MGRFGPLGALPSAAADDPSTESGFDEDYLAPGIAALAMLAWIGVTFIVSAALLRARDLD